VDYLLAQVNIGRMLAPLDSAQLADFVAALDPVNAAPGFVWRLQTEDGNATAMQAFQWDRAGSAGVLVNMSVWESVEALAAYVYSDTHRQVLKRRRQWFERMTEAYAALWWIPARHTPTTAEISRGAGRGIRPRARDSAMHSPGRGYGVDLVTGRSAWH